MIKNMNDDTVTITISDDDLLRSIALIEDMREYIMEKQEEGAEETAVSLEVAIETMKAFWREHFTEEGNRDDKP